MGRCIRKFGPDSMTVGMCSFFYTYIMYILIYICVCVCVQFYLSIYFLFVFGCAGSSLLGGLFSGCGERRLLFVGVASLVAEDGL